MALRASQDPNLENFEEWYFHGALPEHTDDSEQVIRLSDTTNMLRRLATAMVREHGVYYCVMDGKRTKVVP